MDEGLLILDFGSQYTQLIGRRVREMQVYCEIYPYTLSKEKRPAFNILGVILSGGPASVNASSPPEIPQWVFELNVPIFGICYGMQVLARQLGGEVKSGQIREYGHARFFPESQSLLFRSVPVDVWMSHGDSVSVLPEGFSVLGHTDDTPIAAMGDTRRHWYGVQFHPEVTHTEEGVLLLRKFVFDICKSSPSWTTSHVIHTAIETIRSTVKEEKVLLALSGGVDSSVVASLLHRAIGSQLVCVFVDTGLLRLNEASQVQKMFESLGLSIISVERQAVFFEALKGVSDPEEKRKIIGKTFIDVFVEEAEKLSHIAWFAQGTIYPDVIESAAIPGHGGTELIKSHHNVGGLPEILPFKLLEPIRTLFKDEVRAMGIELGLPKAMVYRHPFPGPGLGVRLLGEIKLSSIEKLRQADAIFIQALQDADLYETVSQAFAVYLPVKSVGVVGDGRCYEDVIALRAVVTDDFMTAHWARLPWDFLSHVSHRIVNEVKGISRVVYDISGKPPATIEWE